MKKLTEQKSSIRRRLLYREISIYFHTNNFEIKREEMYDKIT